MGGWVAVLVPYTCIQPTRQHFTGRHGAYPELSALLGGQVPDLRGLFLRGHGGNSAALGVQQGDAIRNITGGAGYIQFHQNTGSAAGAFYLSGNGGRARINGSEYEPYLNFDASRVVPTAPETVR